MQKQILLLAAMAVGLVMGGCAYFIVKPMPFSKSRWDTLTPEQQQETVDWQNNLTRRAAEEARKR